MIICWKKVKFISKQSMKILTTFIIVILGAILGSLLRDSKKQSMGELCGISINEVSIVLIDKHEGSTEDIKQYFDGYLKQYSGDLGNTAHRIFCLYNENDKLLLEIEDIGNNNIVRLTGENINGYYQFYPK